LGWEVSYRIDSAIVPGENVKYRIYRIIGAVVGLGSVAMASSVFYGDENKIFIGGLPRDSTTEMLHSYFSTFGVLLACDVITPTGGAQPWVWYVSEQSANLLQLLPHTVVEPARLGGRLMPYPTRP
jgi:hypothetical protein